MKRSLADLPTLQRHNVIVPSRMFGLARIVIQCVPAVSSAAEVEGEP